LFLVKLVQERKIRIGYGMQPFQFVFNPLGFLLATDFAV
jgi:hypothetical protein